MSELMVWQIASTGTIGSPARLRSAQIAYRPNTRRKCTNLTAMDTYLRI